MDRPYGLGVDRHGRARGRHVGGIGGATTTDLVQAGTDATVANGVVTYAAWVETLPEPSRPVALAVNAGDTIAVSLTQQTAGV